jgi:hypothetical protein
MGGDTPFIDNSAFLPTNTKAHLGSEQEFLNAAALTSINFGNLAHKHANLFGQGKGNGQASARQPAARAASQPAPRTARLCSAA